MSIKDGKVSVKPTKEEILRRYFGYTEFRKGQAGIIDCILSGRDALGIMPTGAGKSVCYQVPSMLLDGMTVVISPLISLMRDQVLALREGGIPAAYINSSLTPAEYEMTLDGAWNGAYKILYVAPERLCSESFFELAQNVKVSCVTVDEAHCISQWGQDFRPSYLKINDFIESLPTRPVIGAFTATATDEVRRDIAESLHLKNPYILTTGFDRPNLYFDVKKPDDKYAEVISYLSAEENRNKNGIIYCSTRATVEKVCDTLCADGFGATRYHAGLSEEERDANQDDFLYDRKSIMVATNAFGMGIDKSNVNFVIHYNMPKNLESYYQEAGRAGRDGTPADCILLFGKKDIVTNRFLIEHNSQKDDTEQDDAARAMAERIKAKDYERLKTMIDYCTSPDCLRAFILSYFGEKPESPFCGSCGRCSGEYHSVDVLTDSKKIISCVARMRERFGAATVSDTLRGSKNKRILELGLDGLSTYGIMKDESISYIRDIIEFLIKNGYLIRSDGDYPILMLGGEYKALLSSTEPFYMKTAYEKEEKSKDGGKKRRTSDTSDKSKSKSGRSRDSIGFYDGMDEHLLSSLKQLRLGLAAKQGVPAFVIFSDATLIDMCRKMPTSKAEMLNVSGVGETKFGRYGEKFLEVIASCGERKAPSEQPLSTAVKMPEEQKKSKKKKPEKTDLNAANDDSRLKIETVCEYVKTAFVPSREPVPVSVLADMISALLLEKCTVKIAAITLAKFFEAQGYLEKIEDENGSRREVTEAGRKLGISILLKSKPDGTVYRQNIYNEEAQIFAVSHISQILFQ